MRAKILTFVARLLTYVFFVVVFWTPLYYLVRYQGFSENTTLIATSISILPLLFLFVPPFQHLLERISSVKIQGVEIGFQKAIEESVREPETEQVTLTIDRGREVMYGKANLEEFLRTVRRYLPNRSTRLVVSIDLQDGDGIYLPMVYFQSCHLRQLFDLRAFLFIDSRQDNIERKVLGTIPPSDTLSLIDKYAGNLAEAFENAIKEHRTLREQGYIDEFISSTWARFSESVSEQGKVMRLTGGVFRIVFAEHLEANVISYPLADYELLLRYFEPSKHHLILVRGDKVINVRSIDRVAREIARSAIRSAMSQTPSSKTRKAAKHTAEK